MVALVTMMVAVMLVVVVVHRWCTGGSHVYGRGVLRGAQEDVWRAVPQRDHLVAVRLRRDGLGARQAEVRQLEFAPLVDEQVLWLEVPVEHPPRVAVRQPSQHLVKVRCVVQRRGAVQGAEVRCVVQSGEVRCTEGRCDPGMLS